MCRSLRRARSVHPRGVRVRRHLERLRAGAGAPSGAATRCPRTHERRALAADRAVHRDAQPSRTWRREDPNERRALERHRLRQDAARGRPRREGGHPAWPGGTDRGGGQATRAVVLAMDLMPTALGGDLIASLDAATVERGSFRLGPVDLDIYRGDRIALLGPNGSGKSTLLAALTGELPLATGSRRVGRATVLGALKQDRTEFDGTQPLIERFRGATGLAVDEARTLLAKFDLGADDVGRPSVELSPGERTRAGLAVLMARRVNCLVLDEPTNHLDIPAIEELERALDAYPGTLVIATHDRRLLERVRISRRVILA